MDIERAAAEGKLDSVYVFAGGDPYLVGRAVAAIRDAAVPENLRAFNYDVFEGSGVQMQSIMAAAQTLPMMGNRRLIYVRDLSSLPAAELAKFLPYLDNPSPDAVVVLVAPKADKRIKFYAQAKKRKMLHELKAPRQLASFVSGEANAKGVKLASGAGRRLAEVIGADLARLSLSLEQLQLYAGGAPVTIDDIDDLIAETRERTVFELTDAVGVGDTQRALTAVEALCDQRQSAIGVVMMLARHMRQLSACRRAIDDRMPKGEIARAVGAPPFVVDKLMVQAKRYTSRALDTATMRLAEVDRSLKGMTYHARTLGRPLAERVLLESVTVELIKLGSR